MIISSIEEILVTAAYLVIADSDGNCPLSRLSPEGQENLNLGYFSVNGNIFIAYIERKKIIKEKIREYHIHDSLVPRIYKPYRNMLIEK
jgi:hypothetical protein